MMTRGNAEALGLERQSAASSRASRPTSWCSTPAPPRRWRTGWRRSRGDLAEELFVLMTLGDDRAVRATYVMGERLHAA